MFQNNLQEEKHKLIKYGVNLWANNYQKKMTKDLFDLYLGVMSPYSLKTIQEVVDKINTIYDKFPRIFDVKTELKNLETIPTHYNKTEDLTFPVDKLHTALDILMSNGMDSFEKYCHKVNMPKNDRERVLTRMQVIDHNRQRRGAVQHPNNRKQNNTLSNIIDVVGENVSNHVRNETL
jgi:hypothetical protein